ncbi:MAG: folate-binding protein YgfZ [Gammaproteobacteria bacterium]|nr:folate-binding protein YgfZ [Gammaproteobacteria bacterium]
MNPAPLPELAIEKLSISALPPGLALLSGFSCIEVSGDEAAGFLHGQLTNEIQTLDLASAQLNAYCNPKGRAIAIVWLLKDHTAFQLLLPNDLAPSIAKRLSLYKMRAKVNITVTETRSLIGAVNCDDPARFENSGFDIYALDAHRSLLVGPDSNTRKLIDGGAIPLFNHDYWKLTQILSGEPQVYQSTSESLIPQHINLDLVNGVSFSKGCYPGQEIVARLRYLGKLKQRMIIGYFNADTPLAPGTTVYSGEKKSGSVVDLVGVGGTQVASVNISAGLIEQGEIRLENPDGPLFYRLTMPYQVTTEKV